MLPSLIAAVVLVSSDSCIIPRGNVRVIQLSVHNKHLLLNGRCLSECLMCQDWWCWMQRALTDTWRVLLEKSGKKKQLLPKINENVISHFKNLWIITQKPAFENPGLLPSHWINLIEHCCYPITCIVLLPPSPAHCSIIPCRRVILPDSGDDRVSVREPAPVSPPSIFRLI